MNSKQADNEDVSKDTTVIFLITGCLDRGRRQRSQHQLPARLITSSSMEKNKPCMHINMAFVPSSLRHGSGQPPHCMCGLRCEVCQ